MPETPRCFAGGANRWLFGESGGKTSSNPEAVILAGPIVQAGELLLEPLRRAATARVVKPEHMQIVSSKLEERAVVIGSILFAIDHAVRSCRVMVTNSPIVVGQ